MPFKSSAQMKAAFAGGLGKDMKDKAKQWAAETPDIVNLPKHVKTAKHINKNLRVTYHPKHSLSKKGKIE